MNLTESQLEFIARGIVDKLRGTHCDASSEIVLSHTQAIAKLEADSVESKKQRDELFSKLDKIGAKLELINTGIAEMRTERKVVIGLATFIGGILGGVCSKIF